METEEIKSRQNKIYDTNNHREKNEFDFTRIHRVFLVFCSNVIIGSTRTDDEALLRVHASARGHGER